MTKFLADENISPETITFLKHLGWDVKDIYEAGLQGRTDEDVVDFAAAHRRMILTFDLDFGEIYYFREKPIFGVIVLRIEPQIPSDVNRVLRAFLATEKKNLENYPDALVIIDRTRFRIRRR